MKFRSLPSFEVVDKALFYEPESGNLFWKLRTDRASGWNTRYSGKEAGSISCFGYRKVRLDGIEYFAHRLIWLLTTGQEPITELYHRDGEGTNNESANIRVATSSQNQANTARRNKWGRGVGRRSENCFFAQIRFQNNNFYLGAFPTPELAQAAYAEKAKELHGEFACTRTRTQELTRDGDGISP